MTPHECDSPNPRAFLSSTLPSYPSSSSPSPRMIVTVMISVLLTDDVWPVGDFTLELVMKLMKRRTRSVLLTNDVWVTSDLSLLVPRIRPFLHPVQSNVMFGHRNHEHHHQ